MKYIPKDKQIGVILSSHYNILREGIRRIIGSEENIKIVAEASNHTETLEYCESMKPDVLFIDMGMPNLDLINILKVIKEKTPQVKVLLFMDDYDEIGIVKCILSGVMGYLLKSASSSQLVKAIRAVSEGELWVERRMMKRTLDAASSYYGENGNNKKRGGKSKFTQTQRRIIQLVIKGRRNKEIAQELFISERTVKFHVTRIYKELGLHNRAALILYHARNNPDWIQGIGGIL